MSSERKKEKKENKEGVKKKAQKDKKKNIKNKQVRERKKVKAIRRNKWAIKQKSTEEKNI